MEGEIARSEELKASVKAYAQDCLEEGSIDSFVSAKYYLTSKKDVTDLELTNIKFNVSIKSKANNDYVITSYKKDDKAL